MVHSSFLNGGPFYFIVGNYANQSPKWFIQKLLFVLWIVSSIINKKGLPQKKQLQHAGHKSSWDHQNLAS